MATKRPRAVRLLIEGADSPLLRKSVREAAPTVTVAFASSPEAGARAIVRADAYFGRITPELLAASRRLRWLHSPTIGLEDTMFPELVAHPLVLTHPRGIFNEDIADHVMGFVLCFSRGFHRHVRNQSRRYWAAMSEHRVVHLPDRTLGIVGLGGIGKAVVQRARAAGMRVVAVDPVCRARPAGVARIWRPEHLRRLLAVSDFVVICAPETPATRGLFDEATIGAMKPGSFLINVGRGAIVRLDALRAALESGHLAGAGLDVFETEPLPARHPLWRMDSVVLTPHMAGLGPHVPARRLGFFVDNLVRFVAGKRLHGEVDKHRWF